MIRAVLNTSTLICLAVGLFGQIAHPSRGFDVASVKVHPDPAHDIGVYTSGLRLEARASDVRLLIAWAYALKSYQLITPANVDSSSGDIMYDIVAKVDADPPPTKTEFRQMLQTLLADRFKLKVHWETREIPVYELVVGKNGPKLKLSTIEDAPPGHYHFTGRNNEVTYLRASMSDVVDAITNAMLDRPVLDKTGIDGFYELRLVYTPATRTNLAEPSADDISVFQAVEEQLGLKLQSKTDPVRVVVVDHVEKPTLN